MKLLPLFSILLLSHSLQASGATMRGVSPEPQIVQRAETKYIGLGISHVPGDDKPAKLWGEFSSRVGEIRNISGPAVGLAGDFESNGTAAYAAAREVSDTFFVPSGMQIFTTTAGDYADFTIDGPISELWGALDYIHGKWLPQHGYKTNGACIEVYPENSDVESPNFQMHLLVLLRK